MTTPQHLSDRYELGEILGYGGMSEVHLARDLRLNRDVAIKVLRGRSGPDPSFYLRFRREAQNAAALNHPAIVAVYDTGEAETATGPLPYIVMEYVDGITLRDIVKDDGPMPIRRAIEVIADSCQALNFSHQHGIIHRDVKPANIMISKTGAVKVMDFGIARAVSDAGNSVTQTAAVIGTAQVPFAGTGARRDSRRPLRCLLAGLRPLRIAHRRATFRGRFTRRGAYQPCARKTRGQHGRPATPRSRRPDAGTRGGQPEAPQGLTRAERSPRPTPTRSACKTMGFKNQGSKRTPARRWHPRRSSTPTGQGLDSVPPGPR
ncbi:serine/threonine-protein kinase pknB [Mycobacteroides abscessus 21]|uniref:non-specific serine/threonine protein kinase n=1 Tax=Mycobacteroides abscessus 21 TaxID=1299324 RepID=A0A829PX60_9MYCO|nr:serine/threonine-protein kinase pknB [Mycobacteroides abscessus 21]